MGTVTCLSETRQLDQRGMDGIKARATRQEDVEPCSAQKTPTRSPGFWTW